jgi:hypothetical protein
MNSPLDLSIWEGPHPIFGCRNPFSHFVLQPAERMADPVVEGLAAESQVEWVLPVVFLSLFVSAVAQEVLPLPPAG